MTTYPPPSPPYLGPPAHSSGNNNKPIHRIVIHSTVSATEKGGARNIAAYFRSPSAGGSAHYVVDPGEAVQAAYDSVVCWHAPPNEHSLGIEMCDMPDANSAARWNDTPHQQMLDRTARLTAQLCLAYDVPITFLSVADLKAGMHGITTHNNVSQAWHESSHWDPGAWPQEHFMDLVRDHADTIRHGGDHDDLDGDDMPEWTHKSTGHHHDHKADGQWRRLHLDDDDGVSLLAGPATVSGTLAVYVRAPDGETREVQLRACHDDVLPDDPDVTVVHSPIGEYRTHGGQTQLVLPFTERVAKPTTKGATARRLRFYALMYGGGTFTVEKVDVRANYWPR